jgi:hypothetical protein
MMRIPRVSISMRELNAELHRSRPQEFSVLASAKRKDSTQRSAKTALTVWYLASEVGLTNSSARNSPSFQPGESR